jgi:hypothetical protein
MMWFQKFEFEDDPYRNVDPIKIPLERIVWNRDDLTDVKHQLDEMLQSVQDWYRVALRVYGANRSGKTWLWRYVEKEIESRIKDALVISTRIPEVQPTFDAFYSIIIKSIFGESIDPSAKYLEKLKNKAGTDPQKYVEFLGTRDLAACLRRIAMNDEQKGTCAEWLLGTGGTIRELNAVGISSRLESSYDKYEVLRTLLEKASDLFSTTVLIVDEMENASAKFAVQLSDMLRDLLDVFYDKFVLILSITLTTMGEWYDFGYKRALDGRIDHNIYLDSVKVDYSPTFLRLHQEKYRTKKFSGNQLLPFTEGGIRCLLTLMKEDSRYPGLILPNCGILAKAAATEDRRIDESFVRKHVNRLKDIGGPAKRRRRG